MTNRDRIRVDWTGFPGGPGVSTFYATNAANLIGPLHTFFAAIAGLLPTDVTVQVNNSGDTIDDTTGHLVASWSGAAQGAVPGTSAVVYKAPVGLCVDWRTDLIRVKRRLQGRTFVVPVTSASDTATGAPLAASITTLANAAAALVTAGVTPGFMVWGRPHGASLGISAAVTSSRVPAKFVTLRSRRD